ncbi:unnamed protein product [Chilo suppressalis]|uniref:MYND-type domain-containing protein n=1 Tax=Chilo suppressalis TaxID=168631 RepID=A0ABN8ECR8_CHISP|nr:unnamed protein product [Chilo suppressalis]
MEKQIFSCEEIATRAEKHWTYDEYFIGEKDDEGRRSGKGENHWSGAKSLEWYNGILFRDTMHGVGEYRWRYLAREGTHFTYEGRFYCNRMHGYGTMSYPDGKVFTGLFHSNVRWGPGIESQACHKQNVGLWRSSQLVRLTWRPQTPSITPDFCANPVGRARVQTHRIVLSSTQKSIGKTNSAIDLLKQCGSDPMTATEKWVKLYPKKCTDLASLLCHTDVFEREYYNGKVTLLEEVNELSEFVKDTSEDSSQIDTVPSYYYAWNNNKMLVHMMKHSFTHDEQRNATEINLTNLLSGPRQQFKQSGKHELDCRTLLMACYLGHMQYVIQLINEQGVHPDIADSQGNTAIMYAACGYRPEIIHFLVEAGANVDGYNDACCTPLGIALCHYACLQNNIPPSGMLQALLPPPTVAAPRAAEKENVFDWHIERSLATNVPNSTIKSPSKLSKAPDKRVKSEVSAKDILNMKKKTDANEMKFSPRESGSDESFSDDKRLYHNLNKEFSIRINDLHTCPTTTNMIPYIFEVCDMVKDIDVADEEPKKIADKGTKKVPSKLIKDTFKPSKEMVWQSNDKDDTSVDSVEKEKEESLSRIMLTILQLLTDGANPKLVRCPQTALFTAIISECPNLIENLTKYGADINEVYPMTYGYTPLDLAVSRRLSFDNLEVIKVILKCGGLPNHKLKHEEAISFDSASPKLHGPTLLHVVLGKKPENDMEVEVQLHLLDLLLDYGCDPTVQFKGRSALDVAITKNIYLLDVFMENRNTNLNAIINDANETLLTKFFSISFFKSIPSADRFQTLTNLLLYGADPLLECRKDGERLANLFVFTKKTLIEVENMSSKPTTTNSPSKADPRKLKEDSKKPKKEQIFTKSMGKIVTDDAGDYKQAIDLVVECARLLHVRWLQAKLTKELVDIIDKYKHRQWNMIIKEHNHKKCVRLWLTVQRCLEIWDIMKETKKNIYNDARILKYLLCIVMWYSSKKKILASTKLTAEEKYSIEVNVCRLLTERRISSKLTKDVIKWNRPYVRPELTPKREEGKLEICFECALPFDEEKIECVSCKVVSFCSMECMRANIDRANCHPCSEFLKSRYFPTPSESDNQVFGNDYTFSKYFGSFILNSNHHRWSSIMQVINALG